MKKNSINPSRRGFLNYAIAGVMIWLLLVGWQGLAFWRQWRKPLIAGTFAVVALSLVNIFPAMRPAMNNADALPLPQFVDLYVRLRHPHHYNVLSWPALLWLSFLWPIPVAAFSVRFRQTLGVISSFLGLILLTALLGAGFWYVSESLVQMSLWRFSIFLKLFTCIGAALVIPRQWTIRWALPAAVALIVGAIGFLAQTGHSIGRQLPADDADYLAACKWAADNTPVDAVFLVPPQEHAFRLQARRAIVVNFKAVPQFSRELAAWRDRLCDVLEMQDLRQLPTPFDRTLQAIAQCYETRSLDHLQRVADKYAARYVLLRHRVTEWEPRLIFHNRTCFMYDLAAH